MSQCVFRCISRTRLAACLIVALFHCGAHCRADTSSGEAIKWTALPDARCEVLLRKIIDANMANWLSLRTLRLAGTVHSTDYIKRSADQKPNGGVRRLEEVKRDIDGRFEVVFDVEANRVLSKFEPQELTYTRLSDGAVRNAPEGQSVRWTVRTGDYSLTLWPGELTGRLPADPRVSNWDAHHSRIVRKRSLSAVDDYIFYGDVIDPRILMWNSLSPIYEYWEALLSEIEAKGMPVLREEIRQAGGRDLRIDMEERPAGERYRLVVELNGGRFVTVIDMAVGANVVEETHAPLDSDEWDSKVVATYGSVDGVYLPVLRESSSRKGNSKTPKFYRNLKCETHVINEDVERATFTEKAFALRTGDRVIDELTDEMYLIGDDGRMISPKEFESIYATGVPGYSSKERLASRTESKEGPASQKESGRPSYARVLFIGNVVLIAAVVVVAWARAQSRRK